MGCRCDIKLVIWDARSQNSLLYKPRVLLEILGPTKEYNVTTTTNYNNVDHYVLWDLLSLQGLWNCNPGFSFRNSALATSPWFHQTPSHDIFTPHAGAHPQM